MDSKPTTVRDMKKIARALDEQSFVARYRFSYLLVEPVFGEDTVEERTFRTVSVNVADLEKKIRDRSRQQVLYPVMKQGVEGATLVTIGRTKSSDIVLDNPGISKLHAYFVRDPVTGEQHFADAGSTNGTTLNGEPLPPKTRVALYGGERIELGGCFVAIYLPPYMLYEHITSAP